MSEKRAAASSRGPARKADAGARSAATQASLGRDKKMPNGHLLTCTGSVVSPVRYSITSQQDNELRGEVEGAGLLNLVRAGHSHLRLEDGKTVGVDFTRLEGLGFWPNVEWIADFVVERRTRDLTGRPT